VACSVAQGQAAAEARTAAPQSDAGVIGMKNVKEATGVPYHAVQPKAIGASHAQQHGHTMISLCRAAGDQQGSSDVQ
jgi:hypothetical protein